MSCPRLRIESYGWLSRWPTAVHVSPEQELRRTASHEAGHAVVSVYLEVPFDYVEMGDDGTGSVQPSCTADEGESFRELAAKQLIAAYAGMESQRTFHPEQPLWQIRDCAQDDRRKIRDIAAEFGFTTTELSRAREQAIVLVQQLRNGIEATASALLEERKLTCADVKAILTDV
jgi:hypothetical protein